MEVYDMTQIERLTIQCCEMKLKALEMALNSGSFGAHIGGSFSIIEILAAIYEVANIPSGSEPQRDRIILSKAHGALALYNVLYSKGFMTVEELSQFDVSGSNIFVHPHKSSNHAIETSGGSLGLGFSYAIGVALANKRDGYDNKVFVILGDGECNEGIVWEAAMAASNFKLDNITVIVDVNGLQVDGETKLVMDSSCLADKFNAFGYDVTEVDGHDIKSLLEALQVKHDKPKAIIASTIKGHGISFLENNKNSHQFSLNSKKYEMSIKEIKASYGLE